jgi:hypothetical protein
MTAKNVTELEKDIQRKQRALARAKREARLAPLREKTNAEALAEFRRTGQVPQFLSREIEQAFGVKTMTGSVKHLWGDKALPASTFVKGAYRYAVGAQIIGGDDGHNRERAAALPEGSAVKKFLAAGGPPARLQFDITKRNRDSRFWHDGKASYCVDPADVVSMLRRFMRHVAEDEKEKLARLYPPSDARRKACEQLRRTHVLPVGAYPCFYMGSVRYYANGEEIRLSLAKGKVRWGGWIKKEQGEEITFVDVTDQHAAKIIRSFFKKTKAASPAERGSI